MANNVHINLVQWLSQEKIPRFSMLHPCLYGVSLRIGENMTAWTTVSKVSNSSSKIHTDTGM